MKVLINMTSDGNLSPDAVHSLIQLYWQFWVNGDDLVLQTTITDSIDKILPGIIEKSIEEKADYILLWDGRVDVLNAGFFDWLLKTAQDNNAAVCYFKNDLAPKMIPYAVMLIGAKMAQNVPHSSLDDLLSKVTVCTCDKVVLRLS